MMPIRSGQLRLFSNPLWGVYGGYYNIPRNVGVLGAGVTPSDTGDVVYRSGIQLVSIAVSWENPDTAGNFTYATITQGNQTFCYFVIGFNVEQGVVTYNLQIDPITTFGITSIQGLLEIGHLPRNIDFRDARLLPTYDIEVQLPVVTNVANTIGQQMNPVRRLFKSNVNILNVPRDANLPVPLESGTSIFRMSITGEPVRELSLVNTRIGEITAGVQTGIENLTRINALNALQTAWQVPQGSTIGPFLASFVPTTVGINVQSTASSVEPYLRFLSMITISNPSSGYTYTFHGYNATSANVNLITTAWLAPEGTTYSFINSEHLRGIGNLGLVPPLTRAVAGSPWNSAFIDTRYPEGEFFASQQTRMQRDNLDQEFRRNQAQVYAELGGGREGFSVGSNNINHRRELYNFANQALNRAATIANNRGLSVPTVLGMGLDVAGALLISGPSLDLSQQVSRFNSQQNIRERDMQLAQINLNEEMRRTVAPRRHGSLNTSLMGSTMSQHIDIMREEPDQVTLDALARFLMAYGHPRNDFITSLPFSRAVHNVYKFSSVTVTLGGNSGLLSRVAQAMFAQGVRIWSANPSVAGMYNNG